MAGARIGSEVDGPNGERFRLTDYLGQGAFGEVYRAVSAESGRIVAVKLLPLDELSNPDARVALLNEVQLATQVLHPNVVQVLHVETGTSSDLGPYLVMEYIPGGTLKKVIDTQRSANVPIPLTRAHEMMIDIAQGARAINQRLVHRDIKPDNVLLDGTRLRISDFGISKVIDERTRSQTFKGGQAVRYMAPEGWTGASNTIKLDVYSVGIMFYEILTLQHPLERAVGTPADRIAWQQAWQAAHLYTPCPDVRTLRAEVSLGVAQLLRRMAAKRPSERPDWDEVISILAATSNDDKPSTIAGVVELALKRQQDLQQAELAEAAAAERQAQADMLYFRSYEDLIHVFDEVVNEFNQHYQHGRIEHKHVTGMRTATYTLPTGGKIQCEFFPRQETNISIAGGQLIGGGYLSVEHGPSANVLLLREGEDDLYGRWVGCLVDINALVDVRKVIGTRGLTANTVKPFGFSRANDFYEEIGWVDRGMHVFTYEIREDVKQLFTELLEAAFNGPNTEQRRRS